MRIGIDIRSLQNDSQHRGIGTYTRSLIKGLVSMDEENEYIFFGFKNRPLPDFVSKGLSGKVKIRSVTSKRKSFVWLLGQAFFPGAIRKERLNIFHSPEYIVPVFARSKKVITVHDFINTDYPLYYKRCGLIRRAYFCLKDRTLECADRVIAVSEYTKKKIVEFTRVKEEKIKVIYQPADEVFVSRQDPELFSRIRQSYGLSRDFLLYVGALDYHKNIDGLISAFSRVKDKDISLVLAGVKNDLRYFNSINELAKDLGLRERVHILDYIPQDDLVGLYNMAKAVISVSFYEGFGLPVLEALCCGKPVIASGNTSMREILDSSGILVDPYNTGDIADAIDTLLADEKLRKSFSEKALRRSRNFSWQKASGQVISLYKDLLS